MPLPADTGDPLSNPTLRAMLQAAGVWLWDSNLQTETSLYQDGFWEQYGYVPSRFQETFDFVQVVHKRDLRELTKAWRAHLEGQTELYASDWRLRTSTGEWRWIQSRGKVIARDAAGKALRIVGAYTDITELKRSELGLAESTAGLDAVFRSSRDGIALIGHELTLLRANDAALDIVERLTGHRAREGASILEIPPLSSDRHISGDVQLALGGADVPERVTANGDGTAWLEVTYSPVHDIDGSILGVAVGLRDVTEKKRMEQSRLQAMRLESMGLLAGGIAHDFNNLLSAVIGNIDLAMLAEAEDERITSLDEARQAAFRAAELVRELLAFAGKQRPVVRRIDISSLAEEIVRYARKIPGNTTTLHEDFSRDLPAIEADATQIRQVVLNLVVNAFDATREGGGTITVRTFAVAELPPASADSPLCARSAPRYVALQVADDGPGMDAYTRERLWEPFFTTKATGHGLGLPSVLGAVKTHGGTLAVESEPGCGAAFTVFLPAD